MVRPKAVPFEPGRILQRDDDDEQEDQLPHEDGQRAGEEAERVRGAAEPAHDEQPEGEEHHRDDEAEGGTERRLAATEDRRHDHRDRTHGEGGEEGSTQHHRERVAGRGRVALKVRPA